MQIHKTYSVDDCRKL